MMVSLPGAVFLLAPVYAPASLALRRRRLIYCVYVRNVCFYWEPTNPKVTAVRYASGSRGLGSVNVALYSRVMKATTLTVSAG
ncbi:MAG: hypothetical protein [Circoviridae sp.]|nr:MAG: hypothetical protein [Circoviridae sp.]